MEEGPWVSNLWPNKEMTIKHGMNGMHGNDLSASSTHPVPNGRRRDHRPIELRTSHHSSTSWSIFKPRDYTDIENSTEEGAITSSRDGLVLGWGVTLWDWRRRC